VDAGSGVCLGASRFRKWVPLADIAAILQHRARCMSTALSPGPEDLSVPDSASFVPDIIVDLLRPSHSPQSSPRRTGPFGPGASAIRKRRGSRSPALTTRQHYAIWVTSLYDQSRSVFRFFGPMARLPPTTTMRLSHDRGGGGASPERSRTWLTYSSSPRGGLSSLHG